MIYDMTGNNTYPNTGERGYAIHDCIEDGRHEGYELYTDDGCGNGNYICRSADRWWIERIALALEATK